jgi:hypothetical protein
MIILFVFVVSFLFGCAGSSQWAKQATETDIRAASDFDLCHGYRSYQINPGIKSEIFRRNLITEEDWDDLLKKAGTGQKFVVGDKKCMVFAQGYGSYWIEESQTQEDGHIIEIWKNPACEPTLFTLLGRLCDSLLYTFEDNLVKEVQCNGSEAFCTSMGYAKHDGKR